MFIAFVIAYLNYSFSTKKYSIHSLLQYESFNQNIFDPSSTLQMASSGPSSDINNLAQLYESRTNYLRLIKDLGLNISTNDLYEEESIDLEIISKSIISFLLNEKHSILLLLISIDSSCILPVSTFRGSGTLKEALVETISITVSNLLPKVRRYSVINNSLI